MRSTLISLNGMSKLFSSLESNPRSRAASLKFLLVATKAFIFLFFFFLYFVCLERTQLGKVKKMETL